MKYDFKLDLAVKNNSHNLLIQQIPKNSSVLELGCATGYMSAYLTHELNCQVTGVEIDAKACEKAKKQCYKVLNADVEENVWLEELAGQQFDCILCADIIEHLRDPLAFLKKIKVLLKPNGALIASLPNGAHAALRLELLAGNFQYEETGLLDRTHLHLFTYQSIYQVFLGAGYWIDNLTYTFHDLADEIIKSACNKVGLQATDDFLQKMHQPEATAFQYIIKTSLNQQTKRTKLPPIPVKPLDQSLEVYRNLIQTLKQTSELVAYQEQQLEEKQQDYQELADKYKQSLKTTDELRKVIKSQKTYFQGALNEVQKFATELAENQVKQSNQLALNQKIIKEKDQENENINQSIYFLRQQAQEYQQRLEGVYKSRFWRTGVKLSIPLRHYRKLNDYGVNPLKHPIKFSQWFKQYLKNKKQAHPHPHQETINKVAPPPLPPYPYPNWIIEQEPLTLNELQQRHNFLLDLMNKPLISIVMPVYNVKADYLLAAIDSVLQQSYPKWQLCIADDASTDPHIRSILTGMQNRDKRIQVVFREQNGHIVAATNSALALAKGDFIGLMDHDDCLAKDALYFMAQAIKQNPNARLLYSDEDKISVTGERFAHYFKPDYNPDLMLSHNMICHFGVYQRTLLEQLGGMREDYKGAQDYDLALRFIQSIKPSQIIHISRILYHWRAIPESTASGRDAKPYALTAAIKAVSDYLITTGYNKEQFIVTETPFIEGMLRVQYKLPENPPLVSIIIPTKNGFELLKQCIESIQQKTDYPHYEIIVVDNQSDEQQSLDYMQQLQQQGIIKIIQDPRPFNYSAINNQAVEQVDGEIIALLNNDIEAVEAGWLSEMVSHALRPNIGAVGARLWYPNDTLQHGGVVLGLGGVAGHAMKHMPKEDKGYNGRTVLIQNYSAVTAACLVMKKSIFESINGLNEIDLKIAFNDVDFCLRLGEAGFKLVWTPHANLYHHESATRGYEDTPEKQQRFSGEVEYMMQRWGHLLLSDPAYNLNLTHCREDFSLNRTRIIRNP